MRYSFTMVLEAEMVRPLKNRNGVPEFSSHCAETVTVIHVPAGAAATSAGSKLTVAPLTLRDVRMSLLRASDVSFVALY
jgi:hypothetical protein